MRQYATYAPQREDPLLFQGVPICKYVYIYIYMCIYMHIIYIIYYVPHKIDASSVAIISRSPHTSQGLSFVRPATTYVPNCRMMSDAPACVYIYIYTKLWASFIYSYIYGYIYICVWEACARMVHVVCVCVCGCFVLCVCVCV